MNCVYIIVKETGSFSDYRLENLIGFYYEEDAIAEVKRLEAKLARANSIVGDILLVLRNMRIENVRGDNIPYEQIQGNQVKYFQTGLEHIATASSVTSQEFENLGVEYCEGAPIKFDPWKHQGDTSYSYQRIKMEEY